MNGKQATIRVDFEVDGEHLQGRASTRGASARHFTGWLGLVAALDALITGVRQQALEAPETADADRRGTPCRDETERTKERTRERRA